MSFNEYHETPATNASTAVEERGETVDPESATSSRQPDPSQARPVTDEINPAGAPPLSPEVGDGVGAANVDQYRAGKIVQLCRHVKEDGVYCHCPALGGRRYCYNHLRLRGQQMRMARAIAQRLSYQVVLPPLDDLNAVQAALTHVSAALTAGLLERRRAGLLLYALQQAAGNLRFLAHLQAQATLAPQTGRHTNPVTAAEPPRVITEYPEFEAEFGLPPGLDLSLPPQVAFPPAEKTTGWAVAQATPQMSPHPAWTKEDIQLEELEKQRPFLSEKSYCEQASAVRDKIHKKAVTAVRHGREADWEAEAARRNAKEAEKSALWHSMDIGQQRAFMQGVVTGRREEAEEQRWQQELDAARKPAAKARGDEAVSGGKLPEKEAAK